MAARGVQWCWGLGSVRGTLMVSLIFDFRSRSPAEVQVGLSRPSRLLIADVAVGQDHLLMDEQTAILKCGKETCLHILSPLMAPPLQQHYTHAHAGSCYSAVPTPAASQGPFRSRPRVCRSRRTHRPSAATSTA